MPKVILVKALTHISLAQLLLFTKNLTCNAGKDYTTIDPKQSQSYILEIDPQECGRRNSNYSTTPCHKASNRGGEKEPDTYWDTAVGVV